jgi:cell wall-active antibiotic response 4TMS protein YvqF
MRVNRRFLYWGVFILALGAVLVVADLGADEAVIADALRLWPLALVALGLGLVLRRTQFNVAGGMLAAAVPGLVLGGAFAVGPRFVVDCGDRGEPTTVLTREGTFDGPATVSVKAACGLMDIDTAPGNGWQVQAGSTATGIPTVDASGRTLSIDAGGGEGWHRFDEGRDEWHLTLPTTAIADLSVVVNAGEGRVNLPGAQIDRLEVKTNAGRTTVDLSGAAVSNLSATINAGQLSFSLPAATDLVGSLEVHAGALEVCAPDELGLSVHHSGSLSGIDIEGSHQRDSDWESDNYGSATHHADLTIDANFGNVEINPIGGCK